MQRIRHVLPSCLLIVFVSFCFVKLPARLYAATSVRPFAMTTVDFYVADGQSKDADQTVSYFRADGAVATVRKHVEAPGLELNTRRIDFPDGRSFVVSDGAGAKMTLAPKRYPVSIGQRPGIDPSTCAFSAETVLSRTSLAGEAAVVITLPRRWQDGSMGRIKKTRLPDFNCVDAGFEDQHRDKTGEWITVRGVRLAKFVAGDPPAAEFTGFDSYREMNTIDFLAAAMSAARRQHPR